MSSVLLIDDEPNLLRSLKRNLRSRFEISTATGGEEGIACLEADNAFKVVVSDMQMPDIDGLTVLRKARAVAPDTTRIMMTGNADQETAANAVNSGAIFRFVNKPCPSDELADIIDEAIENHEARKREKQLLSKTLTGSISLITEVLALVAPEAYGRAGKLRQMAGRVASELGWHDAWLFEVSAMMSQLGALKLDLSEEAQESSQDTRARQAEISSSLVGRIPRLERISEILGNQFQTEFDEDCDPSVKNGAKLLRVLLDLDEHLVSLSPYDAIERMQKKDRSKYDPTVLDCVAAIMAEEMEVAEMPLSAVVPGMILEEHVVNLNGDIIVSQGHELTESLIDRLREFSKRAAGIREPLTVQIPHF